MERELSMAMTQALAASVQLAQYPKSVIAVHALVLQDGGGALPAALSCASLALADASILLYDLVAACSCCVLPSTVLLDCTASEAHEAEGVTTVACMVALDQLTLLRYDGACSFSQTTESLRFALDGCAQLHHKMKRALLSRMTASAGVTAMSEHSSVTNE